MPKILEEFEVEATSNFIKQANDAVGSDNIHVNFRDETLQKFLGIRIDSAGSINFDVHDGSTWFEQIQLAPASRSIYLNRNVTIGSPGGPEGYGYGYGEEGASRGSLILYGDLYVDDDATFAEDIIVGARLRLGGLENNDLEDGDFWLDQSSGKFSFRQNGVTIVLPESSPIDGGGAANQVAYWSDPNTITGDNDLTWNGATLSIDGAVDITGKLTVGDLIDPTGVEFIPQAANPGGTPVNTIWINSGDGHLYRGAVDVEDFVATHASTHIKDASDEVDGDKIDIDVAFTNIVPDTTPAEVTDAAHLGAILKGIDNGFDVVNTFEIDTVSTINATLTTIATITLSDPEAVTIEAVIIGRRTNGSGRAGYVRRATAYRDGGAATLQGPVDSAFTRESSGAYNATITTSGNDVLIQVKGRTGHDIDWKTLYRVVRV